MRLIPLLLLLTALPALAETKAKAPLPPAKQPASTQMEPGAPAVVPGAFTIAVLPDTQFYAQLHPEIFHNQTQWLVDNASRYNIQFVIQVGDVTQTAEDKEWIVARDAFKRLESRIPWASAPGNHDYGGQLQVTSHRTPFSTWFPVSMFKAMPTFGGVYDAQPDKTDNHYHRFTAGGRSWLVMGMEFSARNDVLRWANDVIAAHPSDSVILFTHAYLDPKTNKRFGVPAPKPGQPVADLTYAEDLWQRVASKHRNVVMVLSGHACYTSHSTSKADTGQDVHEMVVDYQGDVNGGNGWLRLLQVEADGSTVHCQDYSSLIDRRCTMPDRTYTFKLAPVAKQP